MSEPTTNDRNVVEDDEKKRILDLTSYQFEPPETGIYEGELRYYAASIEWAKIIEGHVAWLASIASWPNAEDERYHAIQQILIFLQGITMTMKEDIRDGLYEAMNRLAAQIVSGRYTNISVDENGTVSDPSDVTGGADIPEDDPSTPAVNESKAARFAGALAVTAGVNKILDDLRLLYGTDAVEDHTRAEALVYMQQYVIEAGMVDAIDAYWSARAQGNLQIASLDRKDLAGLIYCNEFSTIEASVRQYIASLTNFTSEQRTNAINIFANLEETQYNVWYTTGINSMSTEYHDANCEPVPTHQVQLQFNGVAVDSRTLKKNHRYLVTAVGYIQDTDPTADIQDAWYHKANNSAEVFDLNDFNVQVGGALKTKPSQNEAPYDATNHTYVWTIDMGTNDAAPQWAIARDSSVAIGSTSPTGGLLLTIQDLGVIY